MNPIYLFLCVIFISCFPNFDNPIDPEVEGAVPPQAQLQEVIVIPYQDTKVFRGRFSHTWENTLGLTLEKSLASQDSFVVIDTLFPSSSDFNYTVSNADSAEYIFRLRAFNSNGLGIYSNALGVASEQKLDLFGPQVHLSVNGNIVKKEYTERDSVLALHIRIWDESALAEVWIGDSNVTDIIKPSKSIVFKQKLNQFANTIVIRAVDSSSFHRETVDTLRVVWDYPNDIPLLETSWNGSNRVLHWKGVDHPDFASWALYYASTPFLDTLRASVYVGQDTSFVMTLSEDADFAVQLVLLDSIGNRVSGENSRITSKSSLIKRASMVWIDQGQFVDQNQKQASLSQGFWMDTTEVTQKAFLEYTGFNPSVFRELENPVDAVSFMDAILYCNKRSLEEGLDSVYSYSSIDGGTIVDFSIRSVVGYRLPSEDEWELAARGGVDSLAYYWGDVLDYPTVNRYLWYSSNAGADRDTLPYAKDAGPQKVALKEPNVLGLYDMLGNLDEWTSGYWQGEAARKEQRLDDKGPIVCVGSCLAVNQDIFENEEMRAVRGGNWGFSLTSSSLSSRRGQSQSVRTRNTGFRTVLSGIGK